jgi:uncharacterized membrane protein
MSPFQETPMAYSALRRATALVALVLAPALAGADTLSLQPIAGGVVTELSADGRAAVGEANRTYEPFHWTVQTGLVKLGRATMRPLGHRSGTPTISADGQVVGATILSDDGLTSTAGRWTAGTGWQMLRPLPADAGLMDGEDSSVHGMSPDGRVAVGLYWRPGQPGGSAHAMAWTAAGGMVDLGSSGSSSRADAASADGSVIVGWDEHPQFGNRRAAVWVNGVKTLLEDSDWPTEAAAVNADGTIIVGQGVNFDTFQIVAMMWRRQGGSWVRSVLGSIVSPRALAGGFAYATGVSNDGSMVVGINRPDVMSPNSYGFVWTPAGGFQKATDWLQANGASLGPLHKLYAVSTISADGSTLAALVLNRKTGTASTVLVRRQP